MSIATAPTRVPLGWRSAGALARVEGRKLLWHPAFFAGTAFAVLGAAMFVAATRSEETVVWDDDAWTVSVGFLMLGILVMVAANYATLRDRRHDTVEHMASLPVGGAARTAGLLCATAWPAATGGLALVAVAAYGTTLSSLTTVDRINLTAVVVLIVLLGTLGVALGTWVPNPFIAPVMAWGLFLVSPGENAPSWQVLAPFVGVDTVALARWHLLYLVGLTVVLGSVALVRHRRTRNVFAFMALGLVTVSVSAAALIPGACSGGVCRF